MKKVLFIGLLVSALTISAVLPVQSAVNHQKSPASPPQKKEMPAKKVEKVVYTCPMHKEIAMDKPGKCPKCGMKLVKKDMAKKDVSKITYTCPMHPNVAMDKPGKCPKCGMKLVKKETKKVTS
jgi:transcription initiation factor IIE alpha subunit